MTDVLEINIDANTAEAIPAYATPGSAGMDLVYQDKDVKLYPGGTVVGSCGIRVALPSGYCALIIPRSGLAKKGITIPNSPGLIDSDYRGPVSIILHNYGWEPFNLTAGMRCAQMVIVPVPRVAWNVVETLDETERNAGGFGSTGV